MSLLDLKFANFSEIKQDGVGNFCLPPMVSSATQCNAMVSINANALKTHCSQFTAFQAKIWIQILQMCQNVTIWNNSLSSNKLKSIGVSRNFQQGNNAKYIVQNLKDFSQEIQCNWYIIRQNKSRNKEIMKNKLWEIQKNQAWNAALVHLEKVEHSVLSLFKSGRSLTINSSHTLKWNPEFTFRNSPLLVRTYIHVNTLLCYIFPIPKTQNQKSALYKSP